MSKPIQRTYSRYRKDRFIGTVARPGESLETIKGTIHVPSGATYYPTPGDPVLFDTTLEQFKLPTTTAELSQVIGTLLLEEGAVTTPVTPTVNSNNFGVVQYADGADVVVMLKGTTGVRAGAALKFYDRLMWNFTTHKYVVASAVEVATNSKADIDSALALLGRSNFTCMSLGGGADGDVVWMHVSRGRLV